MKRALFILFVTMVAITSLNAKPLAFANIFTDNAVLQQSDSVKIWGWGSANTSAKLNTSWDNQSYDVRCDDSGRWCVKVCTPAADFAPHSITLSDDSQSIILRNILFGEVWLCSGQSNMEMVLKSSPRDNMIVEGSEQVINGPENQYMRAIVVGRAEEFDPVDNIRANGGWKIKNSENVKWFSAVGYFFAEALQQRINVPVGLVISAYGGTPIQSWIPETAAQSDRYKDLAATRSSELQFNKLGERAAKERMDRWIEKSQGGKTEDIINATDHTKLPSATMPSMIFNTEIGADFGGILLFRDIDVAESAPLEISLGTIDRLAKIYWNGTLVWEKTLPSQAYSRPQLQIPKELVKVGKNTITVNLITYLWNGGIVGDPEALNYSVDEGKTLNSLAGRWYFKRLFLLQNVEKMPQEGKADCFMLSALYNGMINPLIDYKIKGVLWYQGEANVGNGHYAQMLKDMVLSWRGEWGYEFPFYFAQIAPWKYSGINGTECPELTALMLSAVDMIPRSGIAVSVDLGDSENIHPPKKREVGERLARLALHKTYMIDTIECESPQVSNHRVANGIVTLTFSNASGLVVKGTAQPDFEISEDGVNFIRAESKVCGHKISVWNKSIKKPVIVRYCWRNATCGTIYNVSGLPVPAFSIHID